MDKIEKAVPLKQSNEEIVSSLPPEEDPFYDRFSPRRKRLFVVIVALSVFLSPCSALAFMPAISKIAQDLHTSDNTIVVSNAGYYAVMAISPCIMSPLGDLYGRRPMYLLCTAGFTIFTVLVALSQNAAMFIAFRSITALFGTAFFSLGGSIMGDIYIPQQRGNAMGWTLSGSQLGPALAPVLGGIIVTYTSWRVIFWVMVGLGALTFGLCLAFLTETIRESKSEAIRRSTGRRFVFVKYNPLRVVRAFSYPNLLLGGFMSQSLLYNMCVMTTTIPHVVNPRFNLTSPLYSGLFYLAPGFGYLLGSLYGGKWADRYVKKYIQKRGERVPEDRLRSTYVSFGLCLPASILIYGWSIDQKIGGMPLPIIALFFNGVAQTFCFPSLNAYCVDCLPHLGGDAIASNYFSRYVAGAIATATCLTQINNIGVGWTSTISAGVLLAGFASCLVLIRYGSSMRQKAQYRAELS